MAKDTRVEPLHLEQETVLHKQAHRRGWEPKYPF